MKQQTQTNKIEWKEIGLLDCLEKEASSNKLKLQQKEFLENGKYPIVDQGEKFIAGYTNDQSKIYNERLPVVIFGDHTRTLKFINFPFALGADGVKILVPKENINPKYFYYAIQSLKIKSLGYSRHYKLLKTKKISLPFSNGSPDLKEQERIVKILEEAEKQKERGKRIEELLDEYLKSVFYEMFYNKGFEERKLNEICDVRDGTHDSPKYKNKGHPLITSKNLNKGFIDFSEVNLISEEDFDLINKRSKVDAGDILMPMIGTIGNPIIVPDKIRKFAIKNVALIKFTKTDMSNIYIKSLLDSPYFNKLISPCNRGGTQKFIALKDIRNFKIPLPPLPLQQKFASIVEQVEKMKYQIKKTNQNSEELFNSLMSKAFRGKL